MSSEVRVSRWNAQELAGRIGAELEGSTEAPITAVTTDSRESREGAVFFALDGSRFRGVDFVPEAFGSGCSVVVVSSSFSGEVPKGRAVLRHDEPLEALAAFAASVRREWSCPVIAVTGSSGKTTVKEMTAHVLEARGRVLRSPGNFNTVVGVARAVLGEERAPELAVLEVGASEPGEIARLARIVQPTAACVTNVSVAHLEGFGSLDAILHEKTELLHAVPADGLCVIDGDDPALAEAAAGVAGRILRVGFGESNGLRVLSSEISPDGGTRFRITGELEGSLSVPGTHQLRNAMFALAFGEALGVPLAEGIERLETFPGIAGRLAVFERRGATVADDTYNANPASMRVALDWLAGASAKGRKAVVLGDMLELGSASREFHERVGGWVADLAPDLALFVGEESRAAFEEGTRRMGDPSGFRHVSDSLEAARFLSNWIGPGDVVLVKGSRGMRMERVVAALKGEGSDAL
jgi:UDP-N-acetylmuramoyl-tripeptide--D-alanyl-D-alanine ligase